MVFTENTDLIFPAGEQELTRYYGDEFGQSVIDVLVSCHDKLRQKTVSVVHATTNLMAIKRSGSILMSAGGLGGCMYGMPLFDDGKLHNLGGYIIEDELPMFLKNQQRTASIDTIVVKPAKISYGCVDYLAFGSAYFDIYRESKYFEDKISADVLESAYRNQLSAAQSLYNALHGGSSTETKLLALRTYSENSSIIKMFFFEVLLEYIFLEQNNSTNTRVLERKELYNKPVKDMVFGLNPELATRFSLKNFHASAEEIDKYLCDHKNLIRGYTQGSFPSHLIKRLAQYIESYTLLRPDNLKGHVLFRDFDEREYLEIELAKRLWDEAQRKEVTIVTYRLPKGEIGLMPGKISSYVAKCCSKGYKRGEALSLKLDNKLAVRNTAMRDPYTKQGTL